METHDGGGQEKAPRPPHYGDLRSLCGELNRLGARYVVVGGFAIVRHGFQRFTNDIDLLIETTPENESRVLQALLIFPDRAAAAVKPGEVGQYGVVRIGDEVIVELLLEKRVCGRRRLCYGSAPFRRGEVIPLRGNGLKQPWLWERRGPQQHQMQSRFCAGWFAFLGRRGN